MKRPSKRFQSENKENLEHKMNGKCICEACICGRHHCPDPIIHGEYGTSYTADYPKKQGPKAEKLQRIHKNFILPTDKFAGESAYKGDYNKTGKPEKANKIVPKGELQLSKDPFQANSSYVDDFYGRNAERATPTKHPNNKIMPDGKFDGHSNYNDAFLGNKGERQAQIKPTGQIKVGGRFEGGTSYTADYPSKNNGPRAQKILHQNNKIMPDGKFDGHSNYADHYLGNKGCKDQPFKPKGELKIGGNFEGATSYGADYVSKGKGGKAEKILHKNNDIMPKGKFEGDSEYHRLYKKAEGERAKQIKRDGQLKMSGQPFDGATSYLNDYLNRGKGQKMARSPLPKNFVIPEGQFDGQTNYHQNYLNNKSERPQQIRPVGQLKVGDDKFQGNSSYVADYVKTEGQKSKPIRHPGQLKVDIGKFDAASSYKDQYPNKGSPERATKVRHPNNQIMPQGKFDGATSYEHNYIKNQASRSPQFKPNPQLKVGGAFEGKSTYGQNYLGKANEGKHCCPCEQLQAPRIKVAEKEHIRYNETSHKWE